MSGEKDGDFNLLSEGSSASTPWPQACLAAALSTDGCSSGFTAAAATACVGGSVYVVGAIVLHDYMAAASWALLAGLTALSLARLLWSRGVSGSTPFVALLRGAAPALLKPAAGASPQQRRLALELCIGATLCPVTAVGFAVAAEYGAAFWALAMTPMALGCAAATVTPLRVLPLPGGAAASAGAMPNGGAEAYATCCWAFCPGCCPGFGAATYSLVMLLGAYHAIFMGAFITSAPLGEIIPVTVEAGAGGAGALVTATSHDMHLHCVGTAVPGTPTVVFMHGYSGQARDWSWIQPEVAKVTRACAFDRSGCGLSMPGPDPRHTEQIAAEAYALLEAAKLTGTPEGLVVVGHSFGGYNSRMLRSRHPDLIKGLVLVDPADPFLANAPGVPPDVACATCHHSQVGGLFWLVQFAAPFGLTHPIFASGIPNMLSAGFRALPELPDDGYSEYLRPLVRVCSHFCGHFCDPFVYTRLWFSSTFGLLTFDRFCI
jgi:pimeloyl-ACP methyl ester carboxylesterase